MIIAFSSMVPFHEILVADRLHERRIRLGRPESRFDNFELCCIIFKIILHFLDLIITLVSFEGPQGLLKLMKSFVANTPIYLE